MEQTTFSENESRFETEHSPTHIASSTDTTRDVIDVSDETRDAAVRDADVDGDAPPLTVPVEVGTFTHREVPNPHTTTWKRIWGTGAPGDYPYIGTVVSISTATSEDWKVQRTQNLYTGTTTVSPFPGKSGTPDGAKTLLSTETIADCLPSRDAALTLAVELMQATSTIDPTIPPAMSEHLAVAYCRERHPDHELASRTVKKETLIVEAASLDTEDPITDRLRVIEDVYDDPVTVADSFVETDADGEEREGDTELLSMVSWIESWESRGFDVETNMPATRELTVRHSEEGERFTIKEISDAKRGSVFFLGATVQGEYVEQHARAKMRDSFAVALRDLSRLMRAEIGDSRYYNR